ncbi:MAG TPA: hypothetical protein VFG24_03305 [Nitrosopumilaceae archaeon]|nr:hypothetical protein [Nitrosopumilaceae archaeon]
MDWNIFFTIIGSAFAIISFVYAFLRNFKSDINGHIEKIEKRIDTLEERMFWMATGKKLEDAILEERLKKPKTNP